MTEDYIEENACFDLNNPNRDPKKKERNFFLSEATQEKHGEKGGRSQDPEEKKRMGTGQP